MNPLRRILLVLALLSSAGPLVAAGDLPSAASEPARQLYRDGHAALDRQDWLGAVQRFRSLEAELARFPVP